MVSLTSDNLHFIVQNNTSMYMHKAWDAPVGNSNDGADHWKPSVGWDIIGVDFSTEPVVCRWGPDFFVFGLDMDFTLKYLRYNGASKVWYTYDWHTLGTASEKWISKPATVASYPHYLEVIVIGEDRALYQIWFNGTSWSGFSKWDTDILFNEPPVLTCWGANRLDIFCVGADGRLYHTWWENEFGWLPKNASKFGDLGGPFTNQVQAISKEPGYIDLLVIGRDSKVYHRAYDRTWGPWTNVTPGPVLFRGTPDMVLFASNRFDVFAITNYGNIYHMVHTMEAGWSSNILDIRRTLLDRVTSVSWGPGRIDLVYVQFDTNIGHCTYTTSGGWQLLKLIGHSGQARSRIGSHS